MSECPAGLYVSTSLFSAPDGRRKRLEVAQPAPVVSFSTPTTYAMVDGNPTPQQVRRLGGQAQSFNFDATSRTLLNSYRTPESPLSQFQSQQSLSQYPQWLNAAFLRRLRTSWFKKNHFQKSCHRRLHWIGGAHVIRGGLRLWRLAYSRRVRSKFGKMLRNTCRKVRSGDEPRSR